MGWGDVDPPRERDASTSTRGEVFAILGGSGCGKSTLLRYLIGLEDAARAATIAIEGVGRAEPRGRAAALRRHVPVRRALRLDDVGENVALALAEWTDLPHGRRRRHRARQAPPRRARRAREQVPLRDLRRHEEARRDRARHGARAEPASSSTSPRRASIR